jgi:hypothetical protein
MSVPHPLFAVLPLKSCNVGFKLTSMGRNSDKIGRLNKDVLLDTAQPKGYPSFVTNQLVNSRG